MINIKKKTFCEDIWANQFIQCILQEYGILLGGVSDCEELVGVTHRR